MKADILLGLQWGDEGKGKIVDVLTPNYDIVARFQGGPNAGHTLEFEDKKYVLRSVPSGIFQGNKINIIGNGVVVDPSLFNEEIEALEKSGISLTERLKISKKAHLILPTHRLLDSCYEKMKGSEKIGTTGKGIGPTYTDKVGRNGLRVGDILCDFENKYAEKRKRHIAILEQHGCDYHELEEIERKWFEGIKKLKQFEFIDSEYVMNNAAVAGKKILAEGAQGTLLDVDFGSYPFVTSSNTTAAGACTGLGLPPSLIGNVYGIFKAYCTRVGSGPFPTELFDETGNLLCELGHEFGSVTGRKRRCGWIDLVALKYAVMINGANKLIMMKSDVLDTFDEIKVCTAYMIDGKEVKEFPFEINENVKPCYTNMKGWKRDMTNVKTKEEFSREFNDYILFIEKYLGVDINVVSVGPDREQTIFLK